MSLSNHNDSEDNVDSKMNLYFHYESLGILKVIYFVYHC